MSINITVHGNQLACAKDTNCFKDLQTLRKETFAKERLQRIVQVREQSKDIASKLRRRVHNEEEKQLERIRHTKENELKTWKDRHVKKLKTHYESRMKTFGEAHLNAEREKLAEMEEVAKEATRAVVAQKRGKSAALKLNECQRKTLPKLRVYTPASPKKNAATQADLQIQAQIPKQKEDEKPARPSQCVANPISESSSFDSIAIFQPLKPTSYNPNNYAGDTTSESTVVEMPLPVVETAEESELIKRPFTQVSDFIKKRQRERQLEVLSSSSTALKSNVISSPVKSAAPPPHLVHKPSFKGKENLSQRTLKSSTTTTSASDAARPTVKNYDHSNRLSREYIMASNLVARGGPEEKDAYEAAEELKKLERLEIAAEQQKRSQYRPELALEKEKIRKDYEAMTKELAAITREENKIKAQIGRPATVSIGMARQQARDREKNLNEAVENVLRKNVPITCTKVAPTLNTKSRQKLGEVNVAAKGLTSRPQPTQIVHTPDTSESGQSIVLGRVEKPEPDRLAELLGKVQHQKRLLNQEPTVDVPELGFAELITALKDIETKPVEPSEAEKQLEQRERELRKREAELAEKTKAFFDAKQTQKKKVGSVEVQGAKKLLGNCLKTVSDSTVSSDSSSLMQSASDCPVQIIIKVNKPAKRRKQQRPKPVKFVDTLTKPGKVYPKTPRPKPRRPEPALKVDEVEIQVPETVEISPESSMATTSASTAYRSPPPRLKSNLDEFFKRPQTPKMRDPVAPKPKSPIIPEPRPKSPKPPKLVPSQKPKPMEPIPKISAPSPKLPATAADRDLNPFLVHYINKLLSMSRNSIDNLGVSSSDVPTPGESVINVSANVSQPSEMDETRYKKLRKFIDDNYNFLDEIDETLSRSGGATSLNGTCEENIEKVEKVWAQVLERKEKAMKQPPPPKVVMEKLKPAIKCRQKSPQPPPKTVRESFPPASDKQKTRRTSTPEVVSVAQPSVKPILKTPPTLSQPQHLEEELLAKYATLTENCSKRIADLAEMINKVREEKQRLLQTSLSSAGTIPSNGERPGSTEYLDFALKAGSPLSGDLSKVTNLDDQPSEEITNILKSPTHLRQMGVSKDSGISMLSRPVTATDFRESPKATFEPLLKDIPRITTESKAAASTLDLQASSGRKLPRPPATLARYSPQLDEEKGLVPHELSTILEIETPATSRFSFNQSQEASKPSQIVASADKNSLQLEITTSTGDQLTVENFKSLEDYSRQLKLDLATVHDKLELHLDVRQQVNDSTDVLEPRKFEEVGVQTILVTSSSSGSLPDVVAEMKARNLPHNFESSKQTPEKTIGELSVQKFPEPNGADDLDSLEQDLGKMGLQWAAAMVKKTKESQTLASTSSNSSPVLDKSRKTGSKDTTNTSQSGRPLNLREFLTRELMIRTHSDSNSLSDDSSLSSQFLKSLLSLNTLGSLSSSITISGGQQTPNYQQAMSEKVTPHRTSTPVTQSKTSCGPISFAAGHQMTSLNVSNDLFSGESRLSSVKKGEHSASSTTTTTTSSDISISSNKLNLFGMAKEMREKPKSS